MSITDEMLTGFLDAELSQADMEKVRIALETDDELVMRMAELSEVDQWVVEHAKQIDHSPVPEILVSLAKQIDAKQQKYPEQTNNVVQMSAWKKWTADFKVPHALAAGVAIVASFILLDTQQIKQQSGFSSEVAKVLDTSLSGQAYDLQSGQTVTAQLSFANQQGQFCRQYLIQDVHSSTQIACKGATGWELKAQSDEPNVANATEYQTASSKHKLDQMIDKMIAGAPFDRQQEQSAIQTDWQNNN
ncbi:hypothetical protein [Paraglaciecola aestuariivivens]